jgi:hypothetical protein
MTLEQLLECSAEQLRGFTDEQLLEFFKPVLSVTRPSLIREDSSNNKGGTTAVKPRRTGPSPGSDKAKALEIAQKLGIDLSFMNKK